MLILKVSNSWLSKHRKRSDWLHILFCRPIMNWKPKYITGFSLDGKYIVYSQKCFLHTYKLAKVALISTSISESWASGFSILILGELILYICSSCIKLNVIYSFIYFIKHFFKPHKIKQGDLSHSHINKPFSNSAWTCSCWINWCKRSNIASTESNKLLFDHNNSISDERNIHSNSIWPFFNWQHVKDVFVWIILTE